LAASDVEVRMRERGLRVTSQRLVIADAIASLRHATPEQIRAHVREHGETIDLSTIYRTLETFEGVGMLTHAHIGHGAPTYHVVDEHPHIHLVCHRCEKSEAMKIAFLEPVIAQIAQDHGFIVDPGHLALHGLCADCSQQTKPDRGK